MNDIKKVMILHLFPKLLSLYGEYGNVKIIEKELVSHGYEVETSYFEGYGDEIPSLSEFDFIYIGSGTEKNLSIALARLSPLKQQLAEYIASDKVMLASGNSLSLFGKEISIGENNPTEALGIFEYTARLLTDKRFLGDVLTDENNIFGAPLIGFINNSVIITEAPESLLRLRLGDTLGNDKQSCGDGFMINCFIASQLIGPIAVKNPHVLSKICSMITKEPFETEPDSSAFLAYKRGLKALSERYGK